MDYSYEDKKRCVIRYLSCIRDSSRRAEYTKEKIEQIESKLVPRGVHYSEHIGSGSYADLVPETIDHLIKLRAELNNSINESIDRFTAAYRLCHAHDCRWAVWLHVVEGMIWREVASYMFCSESTIHEMAIKGYLEIYDAMPNFAD